MNLSFLRRPDFFALLLSSAALTWCVSLWLARRHVTDSPEYFYFLYNLGLAAIPLFLSSIIFVVAQKSGFFLWPLLLVWLAFFPNAPYLLTDLIHLRPKADAPFWFDWIFMVSCAGTGLLVGCVSLRQIDWVLTERMGRARSITGILIILALTGFGIYLGRFPRWNSWDIIAQPSEFFAHFWDLISRPHHHPRMVAYSFGVAVMMGFSYAACSVVPWCKSTPKNSAAFRLGDKRGS